METSGTSWCWFYRAECGFWHKVEDEPFILMSSSDLETHYMRNPIGVIHLSTAGGLFQINFAGFSLVHLTTGQTRQIRRSFLTENGFRCRCDDLSTSLPAYWDNLDPRQPYQAIALRQNSSEYMQIEGYVRNVGLLGQPINSIFRVQNQDLWQLYCRKKIQLMRIKGQSAIEEQWLFHGTSEENLNSISTFNFNCRPSDRNRGLHIYGRGSYFAKHASYAISYSPRTNRGTKILVLARVIVGNYRQGDEDYSTANHGLDDYIYDSCVDNPLYPRIFAIFNSSQIYPEYVLEFCSSNIYS